MWCGRSTTALLGGCAALSTEMCMRGSTPETYQLEIGTISEKNSVSGNLKSGRISVLGKLLTMLYAILINLHGQIAQIRGRPSALCPMYPQCEALYLASVVRWAVAATSTHVRTRDKFPRPSDDMQNPFFSLWANFSTSLVFLRWRPHRHPRDSSNL